MGPEIRGHFIALIQDRMCIMATKWHEVDAVKGLGRLNVSSLQSPKCASSPDSISHYTYIARVIVPLSFFTCVRGKDENDTKIAQVKL